ncbi:MAG: hypothetical protein FJ265_18655 [Planctomycetes bacterium]|nr:hypothetical protein [Planctomycetota bacterium]
MSHTDKRTVVTAVILVATLLQGGLAGVAFYGRRKVESDLAREAGRAGDVARQLAAQAQEVVEVPPPPPSRWRLLDGPDVSGTLQVVQAVGDAAGIEFANVKAGQSNSPGKQSFLIAGHGAPEQVCAFLAGIEQHARLLVVESGRFLPGPANDVGFELGLATYHQGGGQ